MSEFTFGQRLQKSLTVLGLTRRDLWVKTAIDRHHLSHIICGHKRPSFITLEKLLIALPQVNARWLITGRTGNET